MGVCYMSEVYPELGRACTMPCCWWIVPWNSPTGLNGSYVLSSGFLFPDESTVENSPFTLMVIETSQRSS